MENNPEAAAAPEAKTEAAPASTTNVEPAKSSETSSVDLHGFTSEQLAEMKKFYDANGGYEKAFNRVKSAISNPQSVEKPVENTNIEQPKEPTSQIQAQPAVQSKPPKGAVTTDELLAQYYFETLSKKPEYATISKEIADGVVLAEMSKLGIPFRAADGSWDNDKINDYLDLRAKTVPAKPTESTPNASAAPTVTYTEVGEQIKDINQAYKVLMEPNHPKQKLAEEFIRKSYNPNSENEKKM